jgi:hypothetical protein
MASVQVVQEFNLFCSGTHPLFSPARPDRTRKRCISLPFHSGESKGAGYTSTSSSFLPLFFFFFSSSSLEKD